MERKRIGLRMLYHQLHMFLPLKINLKTFKNKPVAILIELIEQAFNLLILVSSFYNRELQYS
jgi:hypothetical protein